MFDGTLASCNIQPVKHEEQTIDPLYSTVWDIEPLQLIRAVWDDEVTHTSSVYLVDASVCNPTPGSQRQPNDLLRAWGTREDDGDLQNPSTILANWLLDQQHAVDTSGATSACTSTTLNVDRDTNGGWSLEGEDAWSATPRASDSYRHISSYILEVEEVDFPCLKNATNHIDHVLASVPPPLVQDGVPPENWKPDKRKRSTSEVEDDTRVRKRLITSRLEDRNGRSNRGAGRLPDDDVTTMPGRDSQSKITHREAQAVRHMEQLMSSNLRSFGIGILVENDNMRIWYGDRMGLIVTREFKWLQDEDLTFLRCVAAMGHPDVHGLGILSGVQFSGMALHEYELSHLSIAARRPDALQAEKLEFALAVKDPHVYSEFGVVGRGTTVLAVVAKPDTKAH